MWLWHISVCSQMFLLLIFWWDRAAGSVALLTRGHRAGFYDKKCLVPPELSLVFDIKITLTNKLTRRGERFVSIRDEWIRQRMNTKLNRFLKYKHLSKFVNWLNPFLETVFQCKLSALVVHSFRQIWRVITFWWYAPSSGGALVTACKV